MYVVALVDFCNGSRQLLGGREYFINSDGRVAGLTFAYVPTMAASARG